jgi:thioredoxin reductase
MHSFLLLLCHMVQVYIIHRRNEFRASKVMQKRALEHEKIKVSGGGAWRGW